MTLPNVRVFIVYDMRNNGDVHKPHGMTESNDKREVLCP
jgi:hypothetical protein